MLVKATFDGFQISDYCHILRVKKNMRASNATVELEAIIERNVIHNLDKLAAILNTDEPKPLILNSQPNRYLNCMLDGEFTPSSLNKYSAFKIKLTSEENHWRAVEGLKTDNFDENGRVIVTNDGSSDTELAFDVQFVSDCGFIGIVGPKSHILLGNPAEVDKVDVEASELIISEEMSELINWTVVDNLIPFLGSNTKLSATGVSKTDSFGMIANDKWPSITDKWNGNAIQKTFTNGGASHSHAVNFELMSKVELEDLSGTKANSIMLAFFILDENNRPMMSVEIMDNSSDVNELKVTHALINPENKAKTIVSEGTLSRLRGYVSIEKIGNKFTFTVHNDGSTPITGDRPILSKGDVVYLMDNVTTIYDWNGAARNLDNSIKGIPLRISQDLEGTAGTANAGRYQLSNENYGWVEGFFPPSSIKEAQLNIVEEPHPESVVGSVVDSSIAQYRPGGLLVQLSRYGSKSPYTKAGVDNIVGHRINAESQADIPNVFKKGDRLTIDERAIQLNGKFFNGKIAYDSKPIVVKGGKSEVSLLISDWAEMPKASTTYESRWS